MSYKVSIHCPHCHRYTYLSIAKTKNNSDMCIWHNTPQLFFWWIGICNNCFQPVLVLNDGQTIYPRPLPTPTDERIPENIKNDLDEAKMCFSVDAYSASAVMARRCLQRCCVDKGSDPEKTLYNQIEELFENRIITEDIKNWATAIRWVGNDGAHPNLGIVDKNGAQDILELTEQLLHIVYVTPAIAIESLERKKNKN